MPHLDARALQNDPEGLAFLRDVLGTGSARPRPEGFEQASRRDVLAGSRLPSPARFPKPLSPARLAITPHHAREP